MLCHVHQLVINCICLLFGAALYCSFPYSLLFQLSFSYFTLKTAAAETKTNIVRVYSQPKLTKKVRKA